MIIGQGRDLLGESGIFMNFNNHKVTWNADTIPIEDRYETLYHHQRP
jgi:hypothetical protein